MKRSAGIILYKLVQGQLFIFLVHPGGPFWKNKDEKSWTIPKGEFTENEDPLAAAKREFNEETGTVINGDFIKLDPVRSRSGKMIYSWAVSSELENVFVCSNTFTMEWPPKSGKTQSFPEIDKGAWFEIEEAKQKINTSQIPMLDQLAVKIKR